MPVTMEQVLNHLDREEPDYAQAAQLGGEALPHLVTLLQGDDLGRAAKAASLAGAIDASQSPAVLRIAAVHSASVVRVAAAAAVRYVASPAAEGVLLALLDDPDAGVRKVALRSVRDDATLNVREKVQKMTTSDSQGFIRALSGEVFTRLSPRR